MLKMKKRGAQTRAEYILMFRCARSSARCVTVVSLLLTLIGFPLAFHAASPSFRFAVLGDRTGGDVPGVYQETWRETAEDKPDFVITVGDTIEGGNDSTVNQEWKQALQILAPYRRFKVFFAPGNHDVWSADSAIAYERYTKRPLHYSFDFQDAHFTVLDNSRSDVMPEQELTFLRQDLELHRQQPLKFVFSHRPSWILQAVLGNPNFPLHQLAKQYGVQYVIAGHIHQMLHFELDGITYLSMASSGGHLRASKKYQDGWFFQHSLVTVKGGSVDFRIKELRAPFGEARTTQPKDWGSAGLAAKD